MSLSQKVDKEIFRTIFIDHWDSFKERNPAYDSSQFEDPVQKMLGCGKESGGYSEHRCVHCGGDVRRIGFSCKSCFCLFCAKKYVDDFVEQVSHVLHGGMHYRHIVWVWLFCIFRYDDPAIAILFIRLVRVYLIILRWPVFLAYDFEFVVAGTEPSA